MSLYHYTDVNAVHSILRNKKIWLTDIRFLNDSQELHDGFLVLNNTLGNIKRDLFSSIEMKEKAASFIKSMLMDGEKYKSDLEPLYIFSLSDNNDQLSQWRSYGSYAIEFDENELKSYIGDIKPCIYDEQIKIRKSEGVVNSAITTIINDFEKYNGCSGPESIDEIINLEYEVAFFKHGGFEEEKEYRVVIQSAEENYKNNTKFRPIENILVPYIEMDISLDCIKSIQVGPLEKQELACISMEEFVRNIEKEWQVESSNIEYELSVVKSEIPYRE